MEIVNILLLLIFIACVPTVAYFLFFSFAGHFYKNKSYDNNGIFKKIAVFIPTGKEDVGITQTARQALFQHYPSHRYDVIVIADAVPEETILELKKLPLTVLQVKTNIRKKVKVLNEAFRQLQNPYDMAVILDANHVMLPDFLDKINKAAVSGCYAIQGHRAVRNKSTRYATLDAVSEAINNHILRKGQVAVGLSGAITGSGMAFSYLYLKQVIAEIDTDKGFEQELEMTLIDDNHRIEYLDDAIILDEKDQKPEVFADQLTNWISAQIIYLKKYWFRGLLNLLVGRVDYANKVMHYALIPKVLLLGIISCMAFVNAFVPSAGPGTFLWITLGLIYISSYIIAIPTSYWNKDLAVSLLSIPRTLLMMIMAMVRSKNTSKQFIHTPQTANIE